LAKGIDILIDRLITRFENYLYTSNDCEFNGRIFRNVKQDGIVPEVFENGEYRDVLLNDNKDLTCFFDVQPNETYDFHYVSEVWVCFSVNLSNLHAGVSERATEYVHENVIKQIKKIGGWKVTGLVRGLPAFADYARVKPSDDLHDYYLFRVNCEVKYPLNC